MNMNRLTPIVLLCLLSCQGKKPPANTTINPENAIVKQEKTTAISCVSNLPSRFAATTAQAPDDAAHPGMVWIPGGTFRMGADNAQAMEDEYPKHTTTVNGFWIDKTEVTNAQFAAFVKATGYITTAERKPDWEELKQQVPPGTPKPDESLLLPASLVFSPPDHPIPLNDYSQWWSWKKSRELETSARARQ